MFAKLLILGAAEADIDETLRGTSNVRPVSVLNSCERGRRRPIRSIQRNPEMCGFVERHYRRALVRRFPFAILYAYSEDIVTIYAVFHTSRDPGKWRAHAYLNDLKTSRFCPGGKLENRPAIYRWVLKPGRCSQSHRDD